jgi:prepilin-type N-terminal cleavage/methylation domain-containing protein
VNARGYTLIEVLITMAISMIGFVAILDLQTSSLRGVSTSRDTTTAIHLAEHFIEQVRGTSLGCVPGTNSTACAFLPTAPGEGEWLVYTEGTASNDDNMLSPAGPDPDGIDSGLATEMGVDIRRMYCIQHRSAWIVENQLMRLDTRVLFPKGTTNMVEYAKCELDLIPLPFSADPLEVGLITLSTSIPIQLF